MLPWLVLIVLLAALTVLLMWLFGKIFRDDEVLDAPETSRAAMTANRQAVARGDWDGIAIDVASRGYRQDQVDDLLAVLAAKIEQLETAAAAPAAPAAVAESEAEAEEPARPSILDSIPDAPAEPEETSVETSVEAPESEPTRITMEVPAVAEGEAQPQYPTGSIVIRRHDGTTRVVMPQEEK